MDNKRFKGKIGDEYDRIKLAQPQYAACERKIGEILKSYFSRRKGDELDVFEIGCGSGFTSEIILKTDRRVRLTAVDNEPKMLAQAMHRLAEHLKAGGVSIIKADALEFVRKSPPTKFDAFASGLTIHNFNFKYRRQFIKEVYRMLKPGGLFVNMDRYAHDDPKVFKKWLDWQIGMYKKVFPELGKPELVEQWLEHEKYDSRPDVIMKMKPALADMKDVGFKDIKFVFRRRTYSVLTAKK